MIELASHRAVLVVALTACGGVAEEEPDDSFTGTITIQQANSKIAFSGTSCRTDAPVPTDPKLHTETSYFRAYALEDHKIRGPFRVTEVEFSTSRVVIDPAERGFMIELQIFDYTGPVGGDTIDTSQLTLKGSTSIDFTATRETQTDYKQPLLAEIEAPAFVYKVFLPQQAPKKHIFFLGFTNQGESEPSYSACAGKQPETQTAHGLVNAGLLMSVSGQAD